MLKYDTFFLLCVADAQQWDLILSAAHMPLARTLIRESASVFFSNLVASALFPQQQQNMSAAERLAQLRFLFQTARHSKAAFSVVLSVLRVLLPDSETLLQAFAAAMAESDAQEGE